MAWNDLISSDLAAVVLSSAPATDAAQVVEAEWFGTGHLIALILMPLLAIVVSAIGGYFVMKAVPDAH